jgi:hypothetical protein
VTEWAIYYLGGSTFTSEDGPPEDAPGLGVLCIAQWDHDAGKREMTHGTGVYVVNWYWWDAKGSWWIGGDDVGLAQYLAEPGWKKVIVGATAPNQEWRETVRRAINDHLEGDHETFEVS